MGLFTAILATAIGIGAGVGISKAVGGGSKGGGEAPIQSPQPLPQAPEGEDAAEKAESIKRRKTQAASKTIYTSPLGVAGEAAVAKKTLLGQ